MLKQIKTLGLSIVIGSILVSNVPVLVHADSTVQTPEAVLEYNNIPEGETVVDGYGHVYDHNGNHIGDMDENGNIKPVKKDKTNEIKTTKNNELNKVMAMYKQINLGRCSKQEQKYLKKYFKDKDLKAAAKEEAKAKEKIAKENDKILFTNQIDMELYGYEFSEIYEDFEDMPFKEQQVIVFVYSYHFNKQLKTKNTIETCEACGNNYITNKDACMFGYDDNCGCEYSDNEYINVPELTPAGVKAAWLNTYNHGRCPRIIRIKETDKMIFITFENSMNPDKVRIVGYDKVTRLETSDKMVDKYQD